MDQKILERYAHKLEASGIQVFRKVKDSSHVGIRLTLEPVPWEVFLVYMIQMGYTFGEQGEEETTAAPSLKLEK